MKGIKGLVLGLGLISFFTSTTAWGGMVFSFEAAGVQKTTVSGAVTENFDSLGVGTYASYTSPTIGGTYAPLNVASANVYGGAGRVMNFMNLNNSPLVTTLTFTGDKTYFGMWWSAGDGTDLLQFYDGGTLVGRFAVGDLIPFLTPAYYGNPNPPGGNTGEPYAYVDFTTTGGTTFDRVVFTETDGGGFESDNHSVYDKPIAPPGTMVPEASTVIAGALLLVPLGVQGIRRLRNRR